MSEDSNKLINQISEYLTLQLAICKSHSQESGAQTTSQNDRMFWAGAVGTCECLKNLVAKTNLNEVAGGRGLDIAREIFKLTKEEKTKSGKTRLLLKPHCPQCLSSELDEMGETADGVKSFVCRPCNIVFHVLSLGPDF